MVPKASPSAPPTKKRIWTLPHHLSRSASACAGAAASASSTPTDAALRTILPIARARVESVIESSLDIDAAGRNRPGGKLAAAAPPREDNRISFGAMLTGDHVCRRRRPSQGYVSPCPPSTQMSSIGSRCLAARPVSGRITDEITAPAILEIVERPHLPGHLERIAIDRIVPAFDVDRARPAGEPELRDDVDPIAVAKPGRAHEYELFLAEDAVLADHLVPYRRILA